MKLEFSRQIFKICYQI